MTVPAPTPIKTTSVVGAAIETAMETRIVS